MLSNEKCSLSDGSTSGEKGSKSLVESLNIKSEVSRAGGLTSSDTGLWWGMRIARGGRDIVLAGVSSSEGCSLGSLTGRHLTGRGVVGLAGNVALFMEGLAGRDDCSLGKDLIGWGLGSSSAAVLGLNLLLGSERSTKVICRLV